MAGVGWGSMRERVAHPIPSVYTIYPMITSKRTGLAQKNIDIRTCIPALKIDQTCVSQNGKFNVRVLLGGEKRLMTAQIYTVCIPPIAVALEARLICLITPTLCYPIAVVELDVRSID